jgi:hypothetical protein
MKINRHNYEEYFILYLDNELGSEDRRQVETFAQENPDLKAELDLLLQSKLTPDTDIAFADKDSLMRLGSSAISQTNYEEWLTSYIDDELSAEERKEVERFVAGNPAILKELNLLQQTKLQPEAIVFPHKESLYRQEEKAKVVAIRWWRIAAAAVLLIGISTTAIVLLNNKKDVVGGEVATAQPKEVKSTDDSIVRQPGSETPVNEQATAPVDQKKIEPVIKETSNTIVVKQKEKKEQPVQEKNEEPLIAHNNLPTPTIENRYANKQIEPEKAITAIPKNESALTELPLTKNNENTDFTAVTNDVPQPSYAVEQQSSGNKGLRGFFRKVTRTFEKRTNIKATDDDDRLLIAGLAIKMN